MSRAEQRAKRKLEQNPIVACNGVQKKYIPELFQMFGDVNDPRKLGYITYDSREMLGTMYYKSIAGISSMQEMTRVFTDGQVVSNLYQFMGTEEKDFLPHGVTENEFLERLEPQELEKIQQQIVYQLIRKRTFEEARLFGKWIVIIDGTELDEGLQKKNDYYLSRCYNRGTDKEFYKYHRSVLEAKIYFGDKLLCSIASEPIENSEEYIHQNEEQIKQDCEIKAFERLAEKIKKAFPRLPICILADGLYVQHKVFQTCQKYGWEYIIRYKEGAASSIAKDYRELPEIERVNEDLEYSNEIIFGDDTVNLVYYRETKHKNGADKTTEFAFVTSFEITRRKSSKIVTAGRKRWKIENQGFNRQKNWQGDITHACSWNKTAQRNHYLIVQIADFIKQLYEHFFLEKYEIKKTQKNISSELLASFGRQLTSEDISQNDLQCRSTT